MHYQYKQSYKTQTEQMKLTQKGKAQILILTEISINWNKELRLNILRQVSIKNKQSKQEPNGLLNNKEEFKCAKPKTLTERGDLCYIAAVLCLDDSEFLKVMFACLTVAFSQNKSNLKIYK